MKWRRLTGLLLLLALASCASEGGSRGTGISTAVLGNVVGAPSTGEGVRVAIAGTAFQTQSDENGDFSLNGDFEGRLTLIFQPLGASATATLAINVPAAGLLTLNNVVVDTGSGVAVAESQDVSFDGIVTAADCPHLTLAMTSAQQSPADVDEYTVRLDTSTVTDAQGNVLGCADLQGGERALVEGTVNADGSFGHATLQLQD